MVIEKKKKVSKFNVQSLFGPSGIKLLEKGA